MDSRYIYSGFLSDLAKKPEILKNLTNSEKNDGRHYAFYWIWLQQ